MRFARRAAWTIAAFFLIVALLAIVFHDRLRGAAFVVRAAGMNGVARTFGDAMADGVSESALTIPWRGGTLPARKYLPAASVRRPFLLVPGVHASGVDEPRLVSFARDLAAAGHPVVTAGPPDLARYAISPATTDAIEDAAVWLASQHDLAPDGRIGMMGISFAGGLSIVAAGRPALNGKVAEVLSLGGHGDLRRTLRYLCTGLQPDGSMRPPHDYGVVIILLRVVDQVVPPDQEERLRSAVLTFLEASRLDLIDKAQSAAEFERAVALEDTLPEPSRTLMQYVNRRDVAHLGPILLPHLETLPDERALSPALAPAPSAPVFLLHGLDDNVIPASESILLGREFSARHVNVRVLATPLITHAEVDRGANAADVWRLVGFWGTVLGM
jgi:dienelactone hydrolase